MIPPPSRLTTEEQARYARQTILPGMGEEGQLRLKRASVFIVGCGGLGSPAAMYLAAAGIGRLGLCDFDNVEASNLQRQLLHAEQSVGTPKLESAASRLSGLRSDLEIVLHEKPFTAESIEDVRGYDILLDASDNYETRDAQNSVALALGIPLVSAAVSQYGGQVTVYSPHLGGPCYRCAVPEIPVPGTYPTPAQLGIMGAVAGTLGCMEAMETIKLITGAGQPLIGAMLHLDLLAGKATRITLPRDPSCPACHTDTSA